MTQTLSIALGGAVGSLFRFWVSTAVYGLLGRGFPYGTLLVNLVGSFLMGFLFVMLHERLAAAPELRALVLIGFLGGFTTFSSFSIETFNLIEQAEYLKAGANMLMSLALCLAATWIGVLMGRQL
ncbi:MAG: fluoride efflux transporter CrcB [Gammaproteobacteria bacterium]|nr:fluoride efflux transporter CrcB [Gammaproteobacteria bacterium]MBU1655691.1 fluoride efflux transporter CrcB [Gammaproteobacteria bacterium]MBU1961179.1 fluoride efflux transporter CrcB [Gammaproteobacteria bacterium]